MTIQDTIRKNANLAYAAKSHQDVSAGVALGVGIKLLLAGAFVTGPVVALFGGLLLADMMRREDSVVTAKVGPNGFIEPDDDATEVLVNVTAPQRYIDLLKESSEKSKVLNEEMRSAETEEQREKIQNKLDREERFRQDLLQSKHVTLRESHEDEAQYVRDALEIDRSNTELIRKSLVETRALLKKNKI
jgi:hypothetical protein